MNYWRRPLSFGWQCYLQCLNDRWVTVQASLLLLGIGTRWYATYYSRVSFCIIRDAVWSFGSYHDVTTLSSTFYAEEAG